MKKSWVKAWFNATLACTLLAVAPLSVGAEAQREVTLSASAQKSVAQDWLSMRFAVRKDGSDAPAVQAELKQRLQQALGAVQGMASGEALQVQTGAFHVSPRYSNSGSVRGWQGTAELVLSGRDFGLIGQASAKLRDLVAVSVDFSVSSALERKTREALRLEAIAAFQAQAASVSKAFGYGAYELLEANVGSDVANNPGHPVMMARALVAEEDVAVPVQAGNDVINVRVSGRIRLR